MLRDGARRQDRGSRGVVATEGAMAIALVFFLLGLTFDCAMRSLYSNVLTHAVTTAAYQASRRAYSPGADPATIERAATGAALRRLNELALMEGFDLDFASELHPPSSDAEREPAVLSVTAVLTFPDGSPLSLWKPSITATASSVLEIDMNMVR
jgi:hypothetical protein